MNYYDRLDVGRVDADGGAGPSFIFKVTREGMVRERDAISGLQDHKVSHVTVTAASCYPFLAVLSLAKESQCFLGRYHSQWHAWRNHNDRLGRKGPGCRSIRRRHFQVESSGLY